MIKSAIYKGIVTSLLASTLVACGGGSGSDSNDTGTDQPITPTNKAPVIATITPITAMERDSITAVATVTDEDGAIETLLWEQTAGTTVELTNNNSETLEFRAPDINEATTLTFKLTATDDKGVSSSQELTVNLNAYAPLSSLTISDTVLAQCLSDTHKDAGISIVECRDYPIETLSGLSELTGLTTVNITNAELKDLSELANISTLTSLKLDNAFLETVDTQYLETHLTQISALTKLESLSITENDIHTWGNKRLYFSNLDLSGFEQLKTLELANNDYNYETLALNTLQSESLTTLKLKHFRVDDIGELRRFTNLNSLALDNIADLSSLAFLNSIPNLSELLLKNVAAADHAAVETKTGLKKLILDETQIQDFEFLSGFSELEVLELAASTQLDISSIINNKTLRSLSLNQFRLSNTSQLASFTELESLTLDSLNISSLSFLKSMPELKSLDLSNLNYINDLGWLSLTPNLNTLSISQIGNNVDLSVLSNLTKVSTLEIEDVNYNFDFNNISEMQALEKLHVYAGSFEGVNNIALPSLTSLYASAYNFSELIDLTNLSAISSVELHSRESYYAKAVTTLDNLGSNSKLKTLRLEGFPHLENISQLSQFNSLETLTIIESKVADISPVATLTALKSLTLQKFSKFFRADMLASLSKLESLKIQDSAIYCDDQELLSSVDDINTFFSNSNCIKKPIDLSLITDEAFKQCIIVRGYQDALGRDTLTCYGSFISSLEGIAQFEDVTHIHFFGSINSSLLGDPNLAQLSSLNSIEVNGLNDELTTKVVLPQTLTKFKLNTNNTIVYDFSFFVLPTSVTELNFSNTKLADYSTIKNYSALTNLDLDHTGISDLSPLFGLTNLQYLSLYGNPDIDCAQVSKLRESLPNVQAIWTSCN
ncbi:leucine-rich repeat domain-containing protein [Pseudoalteromonas sp. CO348]|uniref:PKD domain-containing protein n=1 Tax=Pseudoalteromonas sp. CO348 TaxID=1777271 RepID=UPI0010231CD7|nr:leucine-rich repeat domain-containing protein [Pseudoalteromonas sp. CO348]RZF98062.1 leucine-rich repeat domain-containing protein [Pseudoalteromonas sp. CO348]